MLTDNEKEQLRLFADNKEMFAVIKKMLTSNDFFAGELNKISNDQLGQNYRAFIFGKDIVLTSLKTIESFKSEKPRSENNENQAR